MRRSTTAEEGRGAGSPWRSWSAAASLASILLLPAAAPAADDYLWDMAGGCRDYDGTKLFMETYPDSPRAKEGRECLRRWDAEAGEWAKVKDCTDIEKVEAFERNHPEGRFVEQARGCLTRLRESDIERLLALCEMHFEANRLTTGVGGTAVECYREVQSRDRANVRAVEGLRKVFEKYEGWARRALAIGDVEKARRYTGKLRELSPEAPEAEELAGAVARMEAERERLAEEAEREEEAERRRLAEEARRDREHARFSELVGRGFSADAVDAQTGWTDLHYAAIFDLPVVAQALLDAGVGADVRLKDGEQPYGDRLTANLDRAGYDTRGWKSLGETALMYAAWADARETADLLLDRGAAVEARDVHGWTPLYYAASGNARRAVELLLDRGAEVDSRENDGGTPLHRAAWKNAREAAQLLLDHGAEVDSRDHGYSTPLHVAASNNAREVAQLLLDHGAHIDEVSGGGWRPLHHAVFSDEPEMVLFLLERGANVNAKTSSGQTPLDFAIEEDHEAPGLLLFRHGGECSENC